MKKINNNTPLKINDHLLWQNNLSRLDNYGRYSVVVIVRYGSVVNEDFYLDFPGVEKDQYMDRHTIISSSKLLEIEKEPEYFL